MKKIKEILISNYTSTALYSLCIGIGIYLAADELNTYDNKKNALVFLLGAAAIYVLRVTNFWIVSKLRESNQLAILDQSKNFIKFINIVIYPVFHIFLVFILGANSFSDIFVLAIILLVINLFSIQNVSQNSFKNENFDELRAHVTFDIQKLSFLFTSIMLLFDLVMRHSDRVLIASSLVFAAVFITKFFITIKNENLNTLAAMTNLALALVVSLSFFLIYKYKFESILASSIFLYLILLVLIALVQNFLMKTLSVAKVFNYVFSLLIALGIYLLI